MQSTCFVERARGSKLGPYDMVLFPGIFFITSFSV